MRDYCYVDPKSDGKYWVHVIVKDGRDPKKRVDKRFVYPSNPFLTPCENYENALKFGFDLIPIARRELEEKLGKKDPTFKEFFEDVYLPTAQITLTASTLELNENTVLKYFMDQFGHKKLKSITFDMVRETIQFLCTKQNEHSEDPKPILPQTAKRYFR